MPLALPAVIEKPSISGCSTLRAASFSAVESRRGCSSTLKSTTEPSSCWIFSGRISSRNLPASIAAMARWCDRAAQASISSRLIPAACAVFQPTVIDMSLVGASGVSTWVGGIHRSSNFSSGPMMRWLISGVIDSDCTPPAISTRSMPEPICAEALPIAVRLPAQCRLTDWPGTCFRPHRVSGVAGEIATAVMGFGEDHVVDVGRVDPGAADDLGDDGRDQRLGRGVDQRPLEGPADRGSDGADDDWFGHSSPPRVGRVNDVTKLADSVSAAAGGAQSGSGTSKCSSRRRNASLVPCWARVLTKLNSPGANCRLVP